MFKHNVAPKKLKNKPKKKLADGAKLFLEKRGVNVESLKSTPVKQLPQRIAVQKLSTFQNQRQQSLQLFAEAYARYLFFKSPSYFQDLSGACRSFQQMAGDKRTKMHTGLVRCILGMKPSEDKNKQRDVVSKFYTAFNKCAKAGETPLKVSRGKSRFGANVSDIVDPRNKKKSKVSSIQRLGHTFNPGEFSLVMVQGTDARRGKIKYVEPLPALTKDQAKALWERVRMMVRAPRVEVRRLATR